MDPLTLVMASALVAAVMGASMVLLYRAGSAYTYLLDWALAGAFFMVSSCIAVFVVKFHVGHVLLLACMNVLYIAGHCGILIGVRRHLGLRPRYDLLAVLAAAVFALHALPYTQAEVSHRLLLFTPIVAGVNLSVAWLLWRRSDADARSAYLPLIVLEACFMLQLSLRIVYIVFDNPTSMTFIGAEFLQTVGSLCVLLFLIIVTMCCALINTRQQEMALRHAALTDALTGWLNRRALNDIARREFRRCRRTATPLFLVAFDIDLFKSVNERYGRSVGDAALCHVAALSARVLHGYGTMFRTGGEEFAVLFADAALVDVHEAAQRVRDAVAVSPLLVRGHVVRMTVSVGVASSEPGDVEWEDSLRRAREALCHAKEHGRNRVSVHGMETRFWKRQPAAERVDA